ncbi:hypothetical protein CFK38_14565 [Brachybacterium vulturis]|uniref:Uncharacterized protein n=1 Tax=Brachybacterium vulturis TaxID=2017484 RepID=A0A291GRF0_9MICO|nr:hypothetical protein [Brachybacterium vulturis]ATG52612.1 hypothetical protein CFK38_14565 [Brachybacterium vulturis]
MDDDTASRRSRATAGASALGATALLVLSFGPSALAVTPSPQAAPTARAAISAPASASTASEVPRRSIEGDDPAPR